MRLHLFLLAAAIVLGQVQPAGVIAIRNAVVHPANGPAMESATVIVRDGLIAAVGAGIAVPADAWVVEGCS
jgi:imidazolonepropionase-like amidohydrolase